MNERSKGKPNFFQRQIDKLIEKCRVQSSGKQISSWMKTDPPNTVYNKCLDYQKTL